VSGDCRFNHGSNKERSARVRNVRSDKHRLFPDTQSLGVKHARGATRRPCCAKTIMTVFVFIDVGIRIQMKIGVFLSTVFDSHSPLEHVMKELDYRLKLSVIFASLVHSVLRRCIFK
jgi:hypothetical protein